MLKVVAVIETAYAGNAANAGNVEKNPHSKTKYPDLRVRVFDQQESLEIMCKERKVTMAYGRWSRHVNDHRRENNSQDQVDEGGDDAENRPKLNKNAEPKIATKKVTTKEPKKTANKSEGKQRSTAS